MKNAIIKYANKYDYNLNTYKNKETKMSIECIKHKYVFMQSPKNHLKYEGCKHCRIEKKEIKSSNKLDNKVKNKNLSYQFKKECKELFKDIYNYTNTYYFSDCIEVTVKCNSHGIFKILPKIHLLGFGCEKCEHFSFT